MAVGPEMELLAQYVADSHALVVPEAVSWRAKQHFLDAIASVVYGSARPAGIQGVQWLDVAYPGAPGNCSVLGTRRTGPAIAVALANGMSAHADETDDSHAPSTSHPGCGLAPAVLAAAEDFGASGADVLAAFIVGYDVGCKIGAAAHSVGWLDAGKWSSHAIVGTFCAAAGAGSIYRFSPEEVRYLLGYTSQLASGVSTWVRDPNHVQKAFVFAGMPATNGVLAASMVRAGCDGVDDVFSGSPNWFQAMSDEPAPGELCRDLGVDFEVMHATIKKYAVGSPAQAAVEAVIELIAAHTLLADEVVSVTANLPPGAARVVDNRSMTNVNVQYLLAGTLLDGGFSMQMSGDADRLDAPDVRDLMSRTTLVEDPAIAGTRAATVKIVRRKGSGTEELVRTVNDVRGTWQNPMTFEETRTKGEDLIATVLGTEKARAACELMSRLEQLPDMKELVAQLTPA